MIKRNIFHRIIALIFILSSSGNIGYANLIDKDSILQYLNINGTEATKNFLKRKDLKFPDKNTQVQAEYLLAFLLSGNNPEQVSDSLARLPVVQKMNSEDIKDLLRFINATIDFLIEEKDTYIITNLTGYKIALSRYYNRESYAFLSQIITYYRLFKDPKNVDSTLVKMKDLVGKDKYLMARYRIMEGYIFMSNQDDNCITSFQKGIEMMEPFLGKSNDFLVSERNSLISDSVIIASAYSSYSRWIQGKGDLKRSGELLIMGKKMIPADSLYVIHQINYYNNLSSIYADLGNPSKSIEYAMLAADITDKKKYSKLRNSSVALFLAKALISNRLYQQALDEYQKVLKTAKAGSKMLRNTYLNIAQVYQKMEMFDLMNSYLKQGDSIEVIGVDVDMLTPLLKGYRAINLKNFKEAIRKGQEVLVLAKDNFNPRIEADALLLLSKAYEGAGNFSEGLHYFKLYTQSIDMLYNQGQEMALFDLTEKYENQKKEALISTLNETNILKNSVIKTQRLFLVGLLVGALALGIFIYLLITFNKKLSSRNVIIEKSVEEKNILLREIHHRVKNNLQVISSLLKLQTVYIKDANAVQAITEGRSRVQAMAILHQNLYSDTSLTGVNIETYFENLIQGLFDTYNINEDKIQLVKNITPLMLDVDTVIPLGLISNELISNALKHAFNESLSGKIEVTLQEINSELVLRISDDGIGYISGKENPGFGSKLIQTLSDKMNAILEISNDKGCTVKVTIKEFQKVG
ncbi:MAG: sensor histidine kinase [Saprospiraceae bacterium]|nr:sensor histidine kinase [Candidatus Brachybacter algidus]MBK8749303.1 sensor histidine kinase [Candidatus Brachybacter algidus]